MQQQVAQAREFWFVPKKKYMTEYGLNTDLEFQEHVKAKNFTVCVREMSSRKREFVRMEMCRCLGYNIIEEGVVS